MKLKTLVKYHVNSSSCSKMFDIYRIEPHRDKQSPEHKHSSSSKLDHDRAMSWSFRYPQESIPVHLWRSRMQRLIIDT